MSSEYYLQQVTQQRDEAQAGMRLAEQLLAKAQDERATYRAAWHSARDRAGKQRERAEAAEAQLSDEHTTLPMERRIAEELRKRLRAAEARIAAVRAQCERWRYTPDRKRAAAEMLRVLDDSAAPEQPAAEQCTGRAGFCHACKTLHGAPIPTTGE
jgi:hypothetical protein